MTYNNIIITCVTACVECGMLQVTGFRGGIPISNPGNREKVERQAEKSMMEVEADDLPDYIDNRHTVWLGGECPVCKNPFYHRLQLPFKARLKAERERMMIGTFGATCNGSSVGCKVREMPGNSVF